jgi:hypothetical protein
MRIDRKLNLVVPVERDGEKPIYVYSAPIGQDVFDAYFLPISKTFSAIYAEGLNVMAGPRVAAMLLKQISKDLNIWEGDDGVEIGLMGEIRRLCTVAAPTPTGWDRIPLEVAVSRGLLDAQDVSEVEGAITFFIVASAMHKRSDLKGILGGMARLWGAQLSSSSFTEFVSSLPTSTPADSSGETATPSSTPS